MLQFFRKSAARKALGLQLYGELIARSRAPVFFREFGVADTIDGRFDLVALHGWLALEHLKGEAAQGLVDAIFIGFDEATMIARYADIYRDALARPDVLH